MFTFVIQEKEDKDRTRITYIMSLLMLYCCWFQVEPRFKAYAITVKDDVDSLRIMRAAESEKWAVMEES